MITAAVLAALLAAAPPEPPALRLPVPVLRQPPERCGPAALGMVLRYYGAAAPALREAEKAYDPVLRGTLITDLAAAARRAGFDARVETLPLSALAPLLADGVPPILLYQHGTGPVTRRHYGVVVAWDPARLTFTVNDGGARPRTIGGGELARRWRAAGSQALIVRQGGP